MMQKRQEDGFVQGRDVIKVGSTDDCGWCRLVGGHWCKMGYAGWVR